MGGGATVGVGAGVGSPGVKITGVSRAGVMR
jgi:hypothetical protein